jgi:putative oxidoreductase
MAAGLLNPIGPLGVIGSMLVASIAVHWAKGFWNSNGGYELPLGFTAAAVAVALTGPGKWSLDALLSISVPQPLGVVLAIITVVGVAAGLASRRAAEQPAQQAASAT